MDEPFSVVTNLRDIYLAGILSVDYLKHEWHHVSIMAGDKLFDEIKHGGMFRVEVKSIDETKQAQFQRGWSQYRLPEELYPRIGYTVRLNRVATIPFQAYEPLPPPSIPWDLRWIDVDKTGWGRIWGECLNLTGRKVKNDLRVVKGWRMYRWAEKWRGMLIMGLVIFGLVFYVWGVRV